MCTERIGWPAAALTPVASLRTQVHILDGESRRRRGLRKRQQGYHIGRHQEPKTGRPVTLPASKPPPAPATPRRRGSEADPGGTGRSLGAGPRAGRGSACAPGGTRGKPERLCAGRLFPGGAWSPRSKSGALGSRLPESAVVSGA